MLRASVLCEINRKNSAAWARENGSGTRDRIGFLQEGDVVILVEVPTEPISGNQRLLVSSRLGLVWVASAFLNPQA